MMRFAMKYIAGSLALPLADYLLTGFWCQSTQIAILAGAVLMLMYMIVRPLLRLLLGLFNVLTLGLLYVALDTALIYLLTLLFPGAIAFQSLLWAVAASLVVNAGRLVAGMLFNKKK